MKIIVSNSKCRFIGNPVIVHAIREKTRIRHPNYFFVRRDGWDGYVRFITEGGLFATGLLPMMLDELKEREEDVVLEDKRPRFKFNKEIEGIGGLTFRDYQSGAIDSVINNSIYDLKYPRGILHEATNAGKTLIAAGIMGHYANKRNGIFLINNKEIYEQLVEELEELMPGQIGEVASGRPFKWKRFNVCMVQTLGIRIKKDPKIRALISQCDIVMVDEADEVVNRKDCKAILNLCMEATVRIALTGTALKSKDKLKNLALIQFFGPVIHRTSNKDLIKAGVSAKPTITFHLGNDSVRIDSSYADEYDQGVIRNKTRHKRIWKLVARKLKKGKGPILILVRYHNHIKRLLKAMPDDIKEKYTVEFVHGKTANRRAIFTAFLSNKVDILISSMIIKRGKNLKTIRTLINVAGGDSESTVLQILGRALRTHETKDTVDVEEFYDIGKFLQRHSKHRIIYYQNDGHEVIKKHTKKLKSLNKK